MNYARAIFRWGSLAVVLIASAWLLWPRTPGAASNGGPELQRQKNAKYVIKFSPGVPYMPGSVPFGIGDKIHGLRDVIQDFESENPDVRIELVNVPFAREYLVTQLSSGQAPDIINVNVEEVWVDVHKGWYVPLDAFLNAPNPYIQEKGDPSLPGYYSWWDMFRYQAISRGKAAPDGRNYCLSFDMVETGIFYNKTIFRQAGVEPPTTWEEWHDGMAKIRALGYIPLLMNTDTFNDWCTDILFNQLYFSILPGIDVLKGDAAREKYMKGYLDADELSFLFGKKFFTNQDPRYLELWRVMKGLRAYCNKDLNSTDFLREFVTQHAAMMWNSSPITYRLQADNSLDFEWGVFYPPPLTPQTSPFVTEPVDMCVIGGSGTQFEITNTAVGDTEPALPMQERMNRSERLQQVVRFLHFLCMPDNYTRIVNEYPCFIPNIRGVEPLPPLHPFAEILERRYTSTKWMFSFDLKFLEIQRRMLEMYLNDGISLEGFMDWQVSNIRAACVNHLERKKVDMENMQATWEALAPLRAAYKDLPNE